MTLRPSSFPSRPSIKDSANRLTHPLGPTVQRAIKNPAAEIAKRINTPNKAGTPIAWASVAHEFGSVKFPLGFTVTAGAGV